MRDLPNLGQDLDDSPIDLLEPLYRDGKKFFGHNPSLVARILTEHSQQERSPDN